MARVKFSFKTKGRVKTAAQKIQRSKQLSSRRQVTAAKKSGSDFGVGKYARRSNTPLSRRQSYKLERKALDITRANLNTKPEMIKAVGQSLAMNTSPAVSSYAATAGSAKIIEANKNNSNINELINGGIDQAGRDNDEEMLDDMLPGGANIR